MKPIPISVLEEYGIVSGMDYIIGNPDNPLELLKYIPQRCANSPWMRYNLWRQSRMFLVKLSSATRLKKRS